MTDYAIIEQLEAADKPSRELDARICAALTDALVSPYPPSDDFGPKSKWQFWSLDGKHFLGTEGSDRFRVENWTDSLDATIALCERKLPGCHWAINADGDAWLVPASNDATYEGHHTKPAIALLITMFKALQAQQNEQAP